MLKSFKIVKPKINYALVEQDFDFDPETEVKFRVWNYLDCLAMNLDSDYFKMHFNVADEDIREHKKEWERHQLVSI